MTSTVDVELRLRAKDSASRGIKAVADTSVSSAARARSATERAAKRGSDAVHAATSRQQRDHKRLASARDRLGIRSERIIQREIRRTEAAYRRLSAAGTLSFREQAIAADKVRRRVTKLTNEMGRLTRAQRAMGAGRGVAVGAAGVAAAGYAVKGAATRSMSFDERLAHMANTAFAERDISGRKLGKRMLESAINRSVGKGGGGTRDQAAEALDAMIASNAVSAKEAMAMLPKLMRSSVSSDTDAQILAQIAVRAKQTFGISADRLHNVLNMALTAGQAGGFELKDMAKWLPQQMAMATMSGMSGRAGFAKLVSLNQAAAITAGSKDEAGNNVKNLLAKIASRDTAKQAEKFGIDLPAYLQRKRAQGVDSVSAFGQLVDRTVAGRADYKALQTKLDKVETDTERRTVLESMASIAQGAGVGQLIQDQQAMMALVGMMNNRQYMKNVLTKVREADVADGGAIDANYALISETSAFRLRKAQQQKEIGQKMVMDKLTPAISSAANAFAELTEKHPLLVGATTLATTALTALAGAAGIASFSMGSKGGKGVTGGGGIRSAAARMRGGAIGKKALAVGKTGGIAGVSAMAGSYALGKVAGEDSAISRYGGSALSGAALGATVGSAIPVVGTMIGAGVGAAGGVLFEGIKDLLKPDDKKPAKVDAKLSVGLAPGLVLNGQKMSADGPADVTVETGNLWGGAP